MWGVIRAHSDVAVVARVHSQVAKQAVQLIGQEPISGMDRFRLNGLYIEYGAASNHTVSEYTHAPLTPSVYSQINSIFHRQAGFHFCTSQLGRW